jgi:hypothetical protein
MGSLASRLERLEDAIGSPAESPSWTKEEFDTACRRLEEEMPGGIGRLKEFLLARDGMLGHAFTPENVRAASEFADLMKEATRG